MVAKRGMAFLVFEGIDGAGKSTLISSLKQKLIEEKQEVVVTREPGGTPLGEDLRKLLLRTDGESPVARTELLLYEAIRAQHVEKVIKPALKKNQWILCDRYTASTLAFQAGGREIDPEPIEWLNRYATDGVEPHLFILLDLPTAEGQKRMESREKDRFEIEKSDFHQRVRNYYLKVAAENPSQWLVLDAMQEPQKIFQQLTDYLDKQKW